MTWPQDAYVGQKVVCIDDTPGVWTKEKPSFKKGEVCIITVLRPRTDCIAIGVNGQTWTWHPRRFRPVQENKKGMEMLTALLNPINHKVLEDV